MTQDMFFLFNMVVKLPDLSNLL